LWAKQARVYAVLLAVAVAGVEYARRQGLIQL
jgi:hypothetical protein